MKKVFKYLLMGTPLVLAMFFGGIPAAKADVLSWKGPSSTLTIGLSQVDITHIEFPEPIINVTVENPDYVDILVVKGYGNRAFRMRSLLPKMATRIFLTGKSQRTYILVVTTDVPYRAFIKVVDGTKVDQVEQAIAKGFTANDMIRVMSQDKNAPGVLRETRVVPDWFQGAGLTFELTEVWQTPLLTGIVVQVANLYDRPNEVNLPAITIPKTSEWGELRKAAMENMRLEPKGHPNDHGVMYLVFER